MITGWLTVFECVDPENRLCILHNEPELPEDYMRDLRPFSSFEAVSEGVTYPYYFDDSKFMSTESLETDLAGFLEGVYGVRRTLIKRHRGTLCFYASTKYLPLYAIGTPYVAQFFRDLVDTSMERMQAVSDGFDSSAYTALRKLAGFATAIDNSLGVKIQSSAFRTLPRAIKKSLPRVRLEGVVYDVSQMYHIGKMLPSKNSTLVYWDAGETVFWIYRDDFATSSALLSIKKSDLKALVKECDDHVSAKEKKEKAKIREVNQRRHRVNLSYSRFINQFKGRFVERMKDLIDGCTVRFTLKLTKDDKFPYCRDLEECNEVLQVFALTKERVLDNNRLQDPITELPMSVLGSDSLFLKVCDLVQSTPVNKFLLAKPEVLEQSGGAE